MGTWNSRGLRGSTLEEMVNWTNDHYLEKGLALIQKIPTPITPVRMDADHKQITLAYFEKRSTVEAKSILGYIGQPTKYYSVEGCNVYMELRKDGTPVNPVDYMTKR